MFYLSWTKQYRNTCIKVEQLNYANTYKRQYNFLVLLKSPSLHEAFEAIVSICPFQFKFESKSSDWLGYILKLGAFMS